MTIVSFKAFGLKLRSSIGLPLALPAGLFQGVSTPVVPGMRSGERSGWIGRGCLFAFVAVARISANRNAGLLKVGAIGDVSSAQRGAVRVDVAYLIVPVGAVSWLAGRWGRPGPGRSAPERPVGGWFGPVLVSGPIAILIAISIARLSPKMGWGDVAFVLMGLALLAITYLFVLKEQPPGWALAACVVGVRGLHASVGLG